MPLLAQDYRLAWFHNGAIPSNGLIFRGQLGAAVSFDESDWLIAQAQPTTFNEETVFTLQRSGVNIGTITWPAATSAGTVEMISSPTTFTASQYLEIKRFTPTDPVEVAVAFAFKGTYT